MTSTPAKARRKTKPIINKSYSLKRLTAQSDDYSIIDPHAECIDPALLGKQQSRVMRLFDRDRIEHQAIIGSMNDRDIFAHRPRNHLLVKRNVKHLVAFKSQGLTHKVRALVRVFFSLHGTDKCIHLGIGSPADVADAVTGFRIKSLRERLQAVQSIERRNAPTDHARRRIKGKILRELLRARHGFDANRKTDFGPHRCKDLTDGLIVNPAIVRAIECKSKSRGIPGLT